MRIALTYHRVDPNRGGAETYVVDLAGRLIAAGHRVDLFAHDWREGCLPPAVTTHRIPVTGLTRWERIWSFATNSEL